LNGWSGGECCLTVEIVKRVIYTATGIDKEKPIL